MNVMIGECTGRFAKRAEELGWGRMWIARDRNIYTYPGEPWGFDNGAFRDWREGVPFNEDAYLRSLDRAMAQPAPVLAVLPDIVGAGQQSLEFSLGWLDRLGPILPWYVAVQDGMEPETTDLPDAVVGVFLGGTNSYKARAADWSAWAHETGRRFHYGRAGTLNKVAHAIAVNADSIDSAFPMWTVQRWIVFQRAIEHGPPQLDLIGREVA